MANSQEELLGNYHWELVEMTANSNSSEIMDMNGVGQQGRLIMTVESVISAFLNDKCKYSNGKLYINE